MNQENYTFETLLSSTTTYSYITVHISCISPHKKIVVSNIPNPYDNLHYFITQNKRII